MFLLSDKHVRFGGDRDYHSILQRYKYMLSPDVARGRWKCKELQDLSKLVQEHPGEWSVISSKLHSKRTIG